ncbi:MAG TPA: CHAT domain-containing protein [Candidatus Kapabacteria bacterium]|nr:CHAT domain-containing protein [Candidatus Kapabacteria bacterium]
MFWNKKSQLVFILVLFLGVSVFGQDARYSTDEKMKEEILWIYKSKGEAELRNFLKSRIDFVDNYLIPILTLAGINEKNEDLLNIALIIAEEKKNEQYVAFVHFQIGNYFLAIGNFEKMIEYFEKALPVIEKFNDPKAPMYAKMLRKIIDIFKNNFGEIEEIIDDILSLFDKEGDYQFKGDLYMGMGVYYGMKGDSINALKMLNNALNVFEKIGNLDGKGKVYKNMGLFYTLSYDIEKSLEMFDKALSFFEKTANLEEIGQINIYRGIIYKNLGDKFNALNMFNKALIFFEKKMDLIKMAQIYKEEGDLYLRNGEVTECIKKLDQASAIFEKEKNYLGLSDIYNEKGDVYFLNGDYANAIKMLELALSFSAKSGFRFDQGFIYETMGIIYAAKGDSSKALELFEKAFSNHQKTGDFKFSTFILLGKAMVLADLGKKDEAKKLYEEVIEKYENLRYLGFFPWMKKNLMENAHDQYAQAASFMLENKCNDKGFKYAESMKARVFVDQMSEGLKKIDRDLTAGLIEIRNNLILKFSNIAKQMAEFTGSDEERKKLNEKYVSIENEFKDFLVKIRLENPKYAAGKYPEPVSLADLQKEILRHGELMLQYFVAKEKTYVFLISRENFQVIPLDITEKEINANINRYFLHFNKKASKNKLLTKDITEGMKKYGKIFYQSIFKPLEKSLRGSNDIIIVPDGQLALIPFESFVIDDSNPNKPIYLLEKYRLKYIQSATTLSMIRKYYHRESNTKSFIGFGDPIYDYENYKQGKLECGTPEPIKGSEIQEILRSKYEREGGLLNRLFASGEEVKVIVELFNKNNQKAVIHLREDATEENAKIPDMKSFDYIHFSCHGVLGDNYQSLVLSQIPQAKEDGYLTLNEIMNCDYNAKLVVLSACQTGTGKIERAEGVTGLTRAMMYAGTPAVVASLWNVSENGAKELMVRFYRNMLEQKMSIEEALRKAKLELIQSEKFYSPFFWSAFVLYGDGVE